MRLVRRPSRRSFSAVPSLTLVALVAVLVTTPAAHAQDPPPATTVSPVATPFVGEYPVWCTSGNPAPNDLCGTHHRTPAIDIGMDPGVEIRAAGDGVVVDVESECGIGFCRGGAGNFVAIAHADGTISRYLHLSETLVAIDDPVVTGELIGLSGATGQSSSPHLHYDEHFPAGTRTPFGPWLACVEGEVVQYPDAFGHDSWLDVPFGSMLVNDGYDCLAGVQLVADAPSTFTGPGTVAVSVTNPRFGSVVELETTMIGDATETTVELITPGQLLRRVAVPGATYSFRVRTQIGTAWTAWSEPAAADPAADTGPTCRGLHASGTEGTAGIDVLIGTDLADTLAGGPGNDIICGGAGDDVISGGGGNDFIDAGPGHDRVDAGAGRDRVRAGLGHDEVDAGDGRDRVSSGAGADSVLGGAGSDVLIGGVGADDIRGENGNDRVKGGGGDDQLRGGGGNDRLFGDAGTDVLDGGAGTDSCDVHESGSTERCES